MPKSSAQNSGFIAPFVLVIVALLVGLGVGYYYAQVNGKLGLSTNKTPRVNSNLPDKTLPLSTRVITDTQTQWGSLINETSVEIKVFGEVVSIEPTKQKIYDGRTIDGTKVTLKKGDKQETFLVKIGADVWQGNISDYSTWKKLTVADVKKGDMVYIRVTSPLVEDASADSYIGWWIFKQI